jgi:hypothetical protein
MVLNTADWVDGFAIFPLLIWMTKECILVNNPDNNADFLIPSSIDLFSNECIIKGRGMSPKCPKHYPKTWARLIKIGSWFYLWPRTVGRNARQVAYAVTCADIWGRARAADDVIPLEGRTAVILPILILGAPAHVIISIRAGIKRIRGCARIVGGCGRCGRDAPAAAGGGVRLLGGPGRRAGRCVSGNGGRRDGRHGGAEVVGINCGLHEA